MADQTQQEKAKSQADKKAGEKYQEKVRFTNKDVRRDVTANRSNTELENGSDKKE